MAKKSRSSWREVYSSIVESMKDVSKEANESDVKMFIHALLKCKQSGGRVFLVARGRSLNVLRAFACRLAMKPIDMFTHDLCGNIFPPVRSDDLLIVCSATGYTQYVIDIVKNWKNLNKNIILITSNNNDKDAENVLWKLVDNRIFVKGISDRYKEIRREQKKQDKYEIRADFSKIFSEKVLIDHFLFEIATLSLLEAAVHELVSTHQLDK